MKQYTLDLIASLAKRNSWFEPMLEFAWNHAFSISNIRYNVQGQINDIKKVFEVDEEGLSILQSLADTLIKSDMDMTAKECAKFVNATVRYMFDKQNYGKIEYWAKPYEILLKGVDDCDGYAVLICKLMELCGIPAYRRKVVAGDTKSGGHAYVIYLAQKDNRWYTLEGSYYSNESLYRFLKVPHNNAMRYGIIWWTTNECYSWSQSDLLL